MSDKQLATRPTGGAVVPVEFDYGGDVGRGYENTTAADFAIPFMNLLQALSPEVQEDPTTRVEGARPGMFINSVTKELIDGKAGFIFVPCDTAHVWVEWVPRNKGGGWVGVHELDSLLVKESRAKAKAFNEVVTPEGNDLMETFYIYGYLLESAEATEPGEAAVLAMTGTKIKQYRTAMSSTRKSKFRPPLWANRFHITSFPTKNKAGQPFHNMDLGFVKPEVRDEENRLVMTAQEASLIPASLDGREHPLIAFGRLLNEQVRSGVARAAFESSDTEGGDAPPF